MSQNNIPNNLPSVDKLLKKITAAERSQQREIRISIEEARELALDLALITSKLGHTIKEIQNSLAEIKKSTSTIDIRLDGGSL
jgi:predicted ribosome quality control (RQC) complex YloA/Tae2 family protein